MWTLPTKRREGGMQLGWRLPGVREFDNGAGRDVSQVRYLQRTTQFPQCEKE